MRVLTKPKMEQKGGIREGGRWKRRKQEGRAREWEVEEETERDREHGRVI